MGYQDVLGLLKFERMYTRNVILQFIVPMYAVSAHGPGMLEHLRTRSSEERERREQMQQEAHYHEASRASMHEELSTVRDRIHYVQESAHDGRAHQPRRG